MPASGADSPAHPAPPGQALALVAAASSAELVAELTRLGYRPIPLDDPYAALIELLERPHAYQALVVSLPALYRDELSIVRTVRNRLPHLDVLLAHTDGRHAALAEAMRLGATGLLSDAAIHRLAEVGPNSDELVHTVRVEDQPEGVEPEAEADGDDTTIDPILTAEELRALLHEQPSMPEQS